MELLVYSLKWWWISGAACIATTYKHSWRTKSAGGWPWMTASWRVLSQSEIVNPGVNGLQHTWPWPYIGHSKTICGDREFKIQCFVIWIICIWEEILWKDFQSKAAQLFNSYWLWRSCVTTWKFQKLQNKIEWNVAFCKDDDDDTFPPYFWRESLVDL